MLRLGIGAPIWRAIVSLETSTLANAVAALLAAACFGYAVRKLVFWADAYDDISDEDEERPFPKVKYVQFFASLAFLLFPPFANSVGRLSPLMFELLPPLASLAVLASLNSKVENARPRDEEWYADDRKCLWPRLVLSGAFAAVGAWEGTIGVVMVPFLLMSLCLRYLRRFRKVFPLMSAWMLGFAIGFAAEGALLHWPLLALKPLFHPLLYVVVFLVACGFPLAAIRYFGETRWTTLGWVAVLALFGTIVYIGDGARGTSASERFARMVVGELGGRKIIIGDGIFDMMIREFKPDDVRLVGTRSVEDREFLLSNFDEGEAISNRAVVVRSYYDTDEMKAAAKELGLELTQPTEADQAERKARVEKLQADLDRSLQLMEDERFANIPQAKKMIEVNAARSNVRKAWEEGATGLKLSTTVLALDMMTGDLKAAEAARSRR